VVHEKWQMARDLADLNGVGDRIDLRGECKQGDLIDLLRRYERPLIVIDIEGAEIEIFCSLETTTLGHADFVIECHDGKAPGATKFVMELLKGTHDVKIHPEGPRDPNVIEGLRGLSQFDRWLLIWEGRGTFCNWVTAESQLKFARDAVTENSSNSQYPLGKE
jgi:hypothetical protein